MSCPSFKRHSLPCGCLPSKRVTGIVISLILLLQLPPASRAFTIQKSVSIKEGLQPGAVVARLDTEPSLIKKVEANFGSPNAAKLQYSILTSGNPQSNFFAVSRGTGEVTIQRVIDRESVCSFRDECQLSFEVAVHSPLSDFFQLVKVMVVVLDVNDNPPEFTQSLLEVSIPEDAGVGWSFQLPTAFDRDRGPGNGVTEYLMLSGTSLFGVESVDAGFNKTNVYLMLLTALERDSPPTYELLVGAKDGGIPSLTGTLTVNVQVSDINDNTPVFETDMYTVKIPEDKIPGQLVQKVKATDADSGPNGQVTYYFSNFQPADNLDYFKIDSRSGEITLMKSVEARTGEEIELVVQARDQGHPPRVTSTTVRVLVEDTVNSMPEVIIDPLGGISTEVSEYAELGKVIAHVSVRDPDSGDNGKTDCHLNIPEFELEPLTLLGKYKVVLKSLLDREVVDTYNVEVTCADKGIPSLTARNSFTVKVLDENDQTPEFSKRTYMATVVENNPIGASIAQVIVTDKDIGPNGQVDFQVVGINAQHFDIDSTGLMTAKKSLDREEAERIIITIRAVDRGVPALTASATVELTLQDVNDEVPEFAQAVFVMEVLEGQPAGQYVGIVSAHDKDNKKNGEVFYHLPASSHQKETSFMIEPSGGVVKTNVVLDREKKDKYEFLILATDKGVPPLTGTATIVVNIIDINDNTPSFVYPTKGNDSISIPHTYKPRHPIVTFLARDNDSGVNGQITYSMDVNTTSVFTLDPITGVLTLTGALAAKDVGMHVLTLIATDQALMKEMSMQLPFYIDVFFDNSTVLATAGSPEPAMGVIVVAVVAALVVVVVIVLLIYIIRRKKGRKHTGMPNSASSSSTTKLRGGYYVAPGVRESSSSFITKSDYDPASCNTGLSEGMKTTNPYVVMIPPPAPAGPPEVVQISRNGNHHGFNDTLNPDLDQTDDGQFSTFRSQENILSPGFKSSSLKRQSDNSSIVKRNDTFEELSCDESTSDSGRGGSDLELNKEKARTQAATPVSMKSGISHQLSPLPRKSEKMFTTFRGESPSSFKFDSDSDTLTHSKRPRAEPALAREDFSGDASNTSTLSNTPVRSESLTRGQLQPQYTAAIHSPNAGTNGYNSGGEGGSSRQPRRIPLLSLMSPPLTCHQYESETDQSDAGSNSNSLSRSNRVPRLPFNLGIEFSHHAYGSSNRNSIGPLTSNSTHPHGGLPADYRSGSSNHYTNNNPSANGLHYNSTFNNNYPNNLSSFAVPDTHVTRRYDHAVSETDDSRPDPRVTRRYDNVISEIDDSRPVSMEEDFLLPPYPETNEDEDEEDLALKPGYTGFTPERSREREALFNRARYESSA